MNIVPASYKNSVDPNVLWIMWRAKWITAEFLSFITGDDFKDAIERKSKRPVKDLKCNEIDHFVKGVKMNMKITEASSRVWTLSLEYENAFETAGYQDLLESCPRIATLEHMVDKLQPAQLKSNMEDRMRLRRNERFHKEDLFAFIEAIVGKGVALDEVLGMVRAPYTEEAKGTTGNNRSEGWRKNRGLGRRHNLDNKYGDKNGRTCSSEVDGEKRQNLSCLNLKCDGHHMLKYYLISTEADRKEYLEEYRAKEKELQSHKQGGVIRKNEKVKNGGRYMRLGADDYANHSTLFGAAFLNGEVEAVVLADPESDANMLPPQSVGFPFKSRSKLKATSLK